MNLLYDSNTRLTKTGLESSQTEMPKGKVSVSFREISKLASQPCIEFARE